MPPALFLHRTPARLFLTLGLIALLAACAGQQTPQPEFPASSDGAAKPRLTLPAETPLSAIPEDASRPAAQFRKAVEELLRDPKLAGIPLGIMVESLDAPATLYQKNARQPFTPASNLKLCTTAASLIVFSPDFRYKTPLFARGRIEGDTLAGDLLVVGSGDPSIGGRFKGNDPSGFFRDWSRALKDKGIRVIAGDLVGDESLFTRFSLYPGWSEDDASYAYAAQTGALTLNENTIDVTVRAPERRNAPVEVEISPQTAYVRTENLARVKGSDRRAKAFTILRKPGENVIEIAGDTTPRAEYPRVHVTINDPARYFMTVLAEVFAREGITVRGKVRIESAPSRAGSDKPLHVHVSPPLSALVKVTNKESNNLFAEQLLLSLGAQIKGKGGREEGAAVVAAWLRSIGVPENEARIVDGSGLSRLNRVSPYALSLLLRRMRLAPLFRVYYDSLPIAGTDGSLARRIKTGPAQGNVHAKTGYISGHRTLAGYVTGRDKKLYSFVIMAEETKAQSKAVMQLQEDLCTLIAAYSAAP